MYTSAELFLGGRPVMRKLCLVLLLLQCSRLLAQGTNSAQKPSPSEAQNSQNEIRNLYIDANEAYHRQNFQVSANICRKIIELSPQDASAWGMLGQSLLGLYQIPAATDAFANEVKYFPSSPIAYTHLALAYWAQHKYEDAAVQFRKQIVINPDDHYAHNGLGMMLHEQKKCADAVPELHKALSLSPGEVNALIALGDCEIVLGDQAKGISELQQAINSSSSPDTWNTAAYLLAERNIQLDQAGKWSDDALMMESSRLRSIALDRIAPEQLNAVFLMAAFWDTRGWIYSLQNDNARAETYLEASWRLYPATATGDHLAQVYEKTGRREQAIRTYAMSIAAVDLNIQIQPDEEEVADARSRLKRLESNIDAAVERGRTDLQQDREFAIANSSKTTGRGDFLLKMKPGGKIEAKRISGDVALDPFAQALASSSLPVPIPQGVDVEIALRGTLSCKSATEPCKLAIFRAGDAVDLARVEAGKGNEPESGNKSKDPHVYDNPAIGMRLVLPDGWALGEDEPGGLSQPHNVIFVKTGSLALFILTREHIESTPDLYRKMLETTLAKQTGYQQTGEESVKRDGLSGTRLTATVTKESVTYFLETEFFSVGDDHYRITGMAPKEIFDRYAEALGNMMHSVTFPMLHADSRLLESSK